MTTEEEIELQINELKEIRYQEKYREAIDGFENILFLLGLAFLENKEDGVWIFPKVGEAMHQIGVAYQNWKKFKKALFQLQETLLLRQAIGDTIGIAYTIFQIPMCRLISGRKKKDVLPDFEKAEEFIEKALLKAAEKKDAKTQGEMFQNLGFISQQKGDIRAAIPLYFSALEMRRMAKDKRGEGLTFARLAECYFERGDLSNARFYLELARPIFQKIGDVNRLKQIAELEAKLKEKEKT